MNPAVQVYSKDQNYFVNGVFIYPKEKRVGISPQYWKMFGYVYTPDGYRSAMALSEGAKLGWGVKFEDARIIIRFGGDQSMIVCPDEWE